ncbi:MAG TPA: phenylalanine--tRNA ligase subunit beta [Chitinophagales bacterium]|nr:phenylalanine--tRNA ligase subunit beta [Chitinophagales bacterium]
MKISLNWLKTFIDFELENESLKDLLTDIGLEVEGEEVYESLPGGLKGLVVAEVLTCVPHPDADKLQITTVSIGDGNPLQVVCGAPNVAVGQKVVLAPVGAKLYPQGQDPFDIKKAKIRGIESNGMLCAEDEIGLGASHEGIIVLPENTTVGIPVSDIYNVENDVVFEIGLTPNRTDAQSHYGVARDLAAALAFRNHINNDLQKGVANISIGNNSTVKVEVLNQDLAPRYAGLVIEGLKVETSPEWLQNRLKAIGQKPINNVVDITNYILHSYGQPLHAFNLSKVGSSIQVKTLAAGTIFKTLDNVDVKLHEDDLMICNADEPMCIAGVYGGLNSGVQNDTTAIFLESAYFDPTSIRKTSMRHGLRTEAAQHFEKGVDPIETVEVLKVAAQMIVEIAGGQVTSNITDLIAQKFEKNAVILEPEKVRKLTGAPISNEGIEKILNLLEIEISDKNENWTLQVPLYRADVTRNVDVIEDILRIYGYNNVPIPSAIHAAIPVKKGVDKDQLYRTAANFLASNGFYEMLNNSLTRSKNIEGWIPAESQVKLLSSINVELDILRPFMHVSALEVLSYNVNRSQKNLKLFEYGKTYIKEGDQYQEDLHLFLMATGDQTSSNWNTASQKVDFYYMKGMAENVLSRMGVKYSSMEESTNYLHEYQLNYFVGPNLVLTVGKVTASISKKWDIKQEVFIADFNWDKIFKLTKKSTVPKIIVSKFPSIRRDLALLLDKNVKFTDIQQIAVKNGKKQLRNVDLFDVYEGEKIAEDKKSYAISYVFKDDEKTMTDKDIDKIMSKMIEQYSKQLNAVVRGQ